VETNVSDSALGRVTENELHHYYPVLHGLELKRKENYHKYKELVIQAYLLEFLTVQLIPEVKCALSVNGFTSSRLRYLIRCYSGLGLPFHLVIESDCDQNMSFTPHNDFHVSIRDFPHIVLEVNSQPNESDQFRMLLQAACLARIGNWLRDPTHNEPIVIMAIYIDDQFKAYQHIVYQPNGSIEVVFHWVLTESLWLMQYFSFKVEYTTRIFDLTIPKAAFEFIFQLYNFFSVAENDNRHLHRPKPRLAEAKESVARKQYPPITTFTKRKREDDQESTKKSKSDSDTSSHGGEEDSLAILQFRGRLRERDIHPLRRYQSNSRY
jgi:hypothetical protein